MGKERFTFLPSDNVSEVPEAVFEKLIEPTLINPTFVTHWPKELVPLAKLSPQKHSLCKRTSIGYFFAMSTVHEIEAAIPKLSRMELDELRVWFENYLEDQLELTDEVKAKLDQSRREIADGRYTTRQP